MGRVRHISAVIALNFAGLDITTVPTAPSRRTMICPIILSPQLF
jgi:hypothetical protein